MSQNLNLSDDLHAKLQQKARQQGFASIEELLEAWQKKDEEGTARAKAVERIAAVRAQLFDKYGEMPDSSALVREDRER